MAQQIPLQNQPHLVNPQDDFSRQEFLDYKRLGDRKSLWHARKNIYLENRRKNFAILHKAELDLDAYVLRRPWLVPLPSDNSDSPVDSGTLRNNPPSITSQVIPNSLQTIRDYIQSDSVLGAEESDRIRELVKSDNFKTNAWANKIKWDSPIWEVNTGLWSLREILNNARFVKKNSDTNIWRSVRHAIILMRSLRPMRRMADLRNPDVDIEPNGDGTNLEKERKLSVSWVLHRVFIRVLHYRGLNIGEDTTGRDQLAEILFLSTCMLQDELANVAPHNPRLGQRIHPDFQVFGDLEDKLEECLDNLGVAIITERRTDREYTLPETVKWNVAPTNFLPRLLEHLETPLTQQFPFWRLWSTLITRAITFNNVLDEEHVEDDLIRERVVVTDEEYLLHELLGDRPEYNPVDLGQILYDINNDLLPGIEQTLRGISRVNRVRQNISLLKDWNRKRPWKQLYLVINTSPEVRGNILPQIQEFHRHLNGMHRIYPQAGGEFIPSNRANIWSHSFLIHPLATTDPLPNISCADTCIVCLEDFGDFPGAIIAQLHCGHSFHFSCIRQNWDHHNCRIKRCPTCRNEIPNLATIANITPETRDVWDTARVTDPAYSATINTLDNSYSLLENQLRTRSSEWANFGQTDIQPSGLYDASGLPTYTRRLQEREIEHEMSMIRYYRELDGELRRGNRRKDNTGIVRLEPIAGIDPNIDSAIADPLQLNPFVTAARGTVRRRLPRAPLPGRYRPY